MNIEQHSIPEEPLLPGDSRQPSYDAVAQRLGETKRFIDANRQLAPQGERELMTNLPAAFSLAKLFQPYFKAMENLPAPRNPDDIVSAVRYAVGFANDIARQIDTLSAQPGFRKALMQDCGRLERMQLAGYSAPRAPRRSFVGMLNNARQRGGSVGSFLRYLGVGSS